MPLHTKKTSINSLFLALFSFIPFLPFFFPPVSLTIIEQVLHIVYLTIYMYNQDSLRALSTPGLSSTAFSGWETQHWTHHYRRVSAALSRGERSPGSACWHWPPMLEGVFAGSCPA